MTALMHNYAPLDITFERGEGAWLFDNQGTAYLDALGGIAVCILGHAHPAIQAALADQATKLLHTSNIYRIDLQEQLAARLTALAGMEKVFFSNSGAEANEAAIKLARLFGHNKGYERPQILVMEGSFHGRTMATLSATGNAKVKQGFAPLLEGFIQVPYNDIDAVDAAFEQHNDIAAILCEPIQGEGGIVVPASGFIKALRQRCDEHECLLMMDEVQTGMSRTGAWFAHQHEGIVPDVMTLAKALGNGMPIGACLAQGTAASLFTPGSHGSTFGGNPLAARVGLTVIYALERIDACHQAQQLGKILLDGFHQNLAGLNGVMNIRGKGLMIGIELDRPCSELVQRALEKQCLINVTAGNVVRLLPSVVINKTEAENIVDIVSTIIKTFLSKEPA